MRVTAAFFRLLCLPGVWVRSVRFDPGRVIVTVALRARLLRCPKCEFSTRHRESTQHHDSVWRHLDLGVWRLVVHAKLRRVRCPEHGVLVEGVPFARDGARFTRDFENLVAWLATKTDTTATCGLTRIDWATVGRIIERVGGEQLDGDRLSDLFEISIDEVAWRKGHRYLTLVADHRTGRVVWGADGKGQAAAGEFFDALDPPPNPSPAQAAPTRTPIGADRDARCSWKPAGIMVPFGPAVTVPADEGGVEAGWLPAGLELDPCLFARASRLLAVSMDMTGGYAKAVRERAPQTQIVTSSPKLKPGRELRGGPKHSPAPEDRRHRVRGNAVTRAFEPARSHWLDQSLRVTWKLASTGPHHAAQPTDVSPAHPTAPHLQPPLWPPDASLRKQTCRLARRPAPDVPAIS